MKLTSLAALAATLAVAGCGGGDSNTVSARAYVRGVCGAVGPFERDIQTRSSALNLASITSAAQGKVALQGFLDAASADTEKAVSQLRAAGTPDVANGPKIAKAIIGAFGNLSTALGHAATQARSLPTNSPSAFRDGADALGQAVRASMGSIGAGLTGLRNAQLEKAAQKEPACTAIGG